MQPTTGNRDIRVKVSIEADNRNAVQQFNEVSSAASRAVDEARKLQERLRGPGAMPGGGSVAYAEALQYRQAILGGRPQPDPGMSLSPTVRAVSETRPGGEVPHGVSAGVGESRDVCDCIKQLMRTRREASDDPAARVREDEDRATAYLRQQSTSATVAMAGGSTEAERAARGSEFPDLDPLTRAIEGMTAAADRLSAAIGGMESGGGGGGGGGEGEAAGSRKRRPSGDDGGGAAAAAAAAAVPMATTAPVPAAGGFGGTILGGGSALLKRFAAGYAGLKGVQAVVGANDATQLGASADDFNEAALPLGIGSTYADIRERFRDGGLPLIGGRDSYLGQLAQMAPRIASFGSIDTRGSPFNNRYSQNQRYIRDSSMNEELQARQFAIEQSGQSRAMDNAISAGRAEAVRATPGRFDSILTSEDDSVRPEMKAARQQKIAAERGYLIASRTSALTVQDAAQSTGEAEAAASVAAEKSKSAAKMIDDAGDTPGMKVATERARVESAEATADAERKIKAAIEANNAAKQQSIQLAQAEYEKAQAVTGELQAQASVLKEKENRLKGGYTSWATMGQDERAALIHDAKAAEDHGLEKLDPEQRSRLLGNSLTGEYFGKKAQKEIAGDEGLQEILKMTGQKDLKTVQEERIKVEQQIRFEVDINEQKMFEILQKVTEQFNKQQADLEIRLKRIQDAQTIIKGGARAASG